MTSSLIFSCVNRAAFAMAFAPCSPGYMLTKLTRTILAHDTELKV